MKISIKSLDFICSVGDSSQFPAESLPEIAFAGRSNVGKSTAINKLLNRKKLAYISSTPGRTQTINFYLINHAFYFVDLPGYGYSKVSQSMRDDWKRLIETYITHRQSLRGVVVIVDLRHPPTTLDTTMIEWLKSIGVSFVVIATKADKLSRSQIQQHIQQTQQHLNISSADLISFSGKRGDGVSDVWDFLLKNFLSPHLDEIQIKKQ